jgi:hypothetical protein
MGQRFLAVGSRVIALLKLPVAACVCECLSGLGGLSTWPPIWLRGLGKFAEQSGWVGLVAGRGNQRTAGGHRIVK